MIQCVYELVGDLVVAVGYFPAAPTLEQIEQLLDADTQKVVFDASNRQLEGVDLHDIVDVSGEPFLLNMVQQASANTMQELTSWRLNLQTKRVVGQRFFFKRSGPYVIAVQQDLIENR